MKAYRHTKIIVTVGPSTQSPERLERLIELGCDVMRLNMAHASPQWVREIIAAIRSASKRIGREVAIMMDVKGPEIRTGAVTVPVELRPGEIVEFRTSDFPDPAPPPRAGEPVRVGVNYPQLAEDVVIGSTMLVDSGLIQMRIVDKESDWVRAEVITPGTLASRRHINLPGVHVRLPALTAKDEDDLRVGIDAGIDFVALSFVRQASDVTTLRRFLDGCGSVAKIIAKIEDQAGVRNAVDIIVAADAVMVARGDLGIEIAYHRLPLVQTELVRACQREGKPVIIATQLLESMMASPMPTRAEISDVSNAIREQADAVMLSGETTTGAYPIEAVEVLNNIIDSIEPSVDDSLNATLELHEPKAKMLRAAAGLAQSLGESGIVVFTRSGYLAYALGALRARGVPIFAFTDIPTIFHQLMLPWGVEPFLMEFSDDPEKTIVDAIELLKRKHWCVQGTWLVVITNALASSKVIDTLQLRQVEA